MSPVRFFLFTLGIILPVQADISIRFPTENDHLLRGNNESFFMYVNRLDKDGVDLKPWTGGTYGFVRTVVETPQGPVCKKFHEGIDIKPLKRDGNGVPRDIVRPVAPGIVMYACDIPARSNYGRYVVIRHNTSSGPLFSLYAHLASVSCKTGDKVGTGNTIGILGYSGVGLNKTRAHLHLELGLMINEDFTHWYDAHIKSPNFHGNYNGLNLAGFDPVPLLKQSSDGSRVSLAEHIASLAPEYKGRIPGGKMPSIGRMYPFLVKNNDIPASQINSWDITFTGTGVPIALEASRRVVSEPVLIWCRPGSVNPMYRTFSRVKSLGNGNYELTASGKSYLMFFRFERDELMVSGQN